MKVILREDVEKIGKAGEVVKVAPLPDPQHGWFDTGIKVYTTHVIIDGSYNILKPGMSATTKLFQRSTLTTPL